MPQMVIREDGATGAGVPSGGGDPVPARWGRYGELGIGAARKGRYRARLAEGAGDLDAVLRLRFEVFNLELGEGLASSFATGRDQDRFDRVCHHLLVEDEGSGAVVGTYRLQTSEMAARGAGFYSDAEFDLAGLPREVLRASVEVGRACIHREHRNTASLFLLWRGLAAYMTATGKRYLFGCSSLPGQDPAAGRRAYRKLEGAGSVHPTYRLSPRQGYACSIEGAAAEGDVRIPVLFRTYLRHGAKVCGPPALDREFGTIDFLTLLDLHDLPEESKRLYFGAEGLPGAGHLAA